MSEGTTILVIYVNHTVLIVEFKKKILGFRNKGPRLFKTFFMETKFRGRRHVFVLSYAMFVWHVFCENENGFHGKTIFWCSVMTF